MTEKKEELFSSENELKIPFQKWENVGDSVKGTLVDKKVIPNALKENTEQTVYTLMQEDGSLVNISGRGNRNPQILPGLEQAKMGQFVGIRFEETMPSKKAGMQDVKVIKVYSTGEMRPEVLASYRGEDVFAKEAEITDEDIKKINF